MFKLSFIIICVHAYLYDDLPPRDDDTSCEVEKKHLKLSQEEAKTYKWRVVRDHVAENVPSTYSNLGVVNFDASTFNNLDTSSEHYSYPFYNMLESLWPGDWRQQLLKMNSKVKEHNTSNPHHRHAKECSEDDWWTIWGIVIFAAKVGKGGIDHLYNKKQKLLAQLPHIDLSGIMLKHRAQELIKFIPFAFHGEDESDPWNPVRALVDGFNDVRAQKVAAAHCKILDETMSGWSPTTTKYGGLPFLSFILRKPTPLGTEFKTVACSVLGKQLLKICPLLN